MLGLRSLRCGVRAARPQPASARITAAAMDNKGLLQPQQPQVAQTTVVYQQQMAPGHMIAATAPIALDATLVNVRSFCDLELALRSLARPQLTPPVSVAVFRRHGDLPMLDVLPTVPVWPDPSARRPRALRHRRLHDHPAGYGPLRDSGRGHRRPRDEDGQLHDGQGQQCPHRRRQ